MRHQATRRIAGISTAVGLGLGVGAWSADIATCPGEVERTGHEVPVLICDENPAEDDLFNNPGTLWQKITFGAFALAGVGSIVFVRSREETQPVIPQSSQLQQ